MTTRKNASTAGTVFWITGLPRSGKSTLGVSLSSKIRDRGYSVVVLDGDAFREACGKDLGYDQESRLKNAHRLSAVCHLLSSQGVTVVCSTVSLFAEIHAHNRASLERFVEVLLLASPQVLRSRDPDLYNAADRGEALIPGLNQSYDLPASPDVVFELSADGHLCLDSAVKELLKWLDE